MATAAESISQPAKDAEGEVSLFRLYILRAMYLVLVVGLGAMVVPEILAHELKSRGVIPSWGRFGRSPSLACATRSRCCRC